MRSIERRRGGTWPRLPYAIQVLTILSCLLALLATPVGTFWRQLPWGHAGGLIRLIRRGATLDERLLIRAGPDYEAIQVIARETPPDAIILISDRYDGPSCLQPDRAKHQDWATYFLYPRKILYLHQLDHRLFARATYLLVDTPSSVSWIDPRIRGSLAYCPDAYAIVPFDMAAYMEQIRAGRISARYLPARRDPGRTP